MKANELRLGNYFCPINRDAPHNIPHMPIESVIYKIWTIEPFKITGCFYDQIYAQVKEMTVFDIKDISPILLTEEWLLRFGFNKKEGEHNIGLPTGGGSELSIENDNSTALTRSQLCDGVFTNGFDYVYIKDCEYVHQLQNLYFALSGTELELKQ